MTTPQKTKSFLVRAKLDTSDFDAGSEKLGKQLGKIRTTGSKSFEELSKKAEKYGLAIEDNSKKSSEKLNALRAEIREEAKSERAHAKLTNEIKLQNTVLSKGVLAGKLRAAQMRLGTGATMEQRREVRKLILEQERLTAAQGKAQGSMRGLRGQAQNLGWQMQDVAVQMQMGTNMMTIFSQQGSQIASGFGPMGAMIGAGIAVAGAAIGAAIPAFSGAKEEVDKLAKAIDFLNSVAEENGGVIALTDEMERLKEYSAGAYRVQQLLAEQKLKDTYTGTAEEIKKASSALSDLVDANRAYQTALAMQDDGPSFGYQISKKRAAITTALYDIREATKTASKEFGLSGPELERFSDSLDDITKKPTAEKFKQLSDGVSFFAARAKEGTEKKAWVEFASTINNLAIEFDNAKKKADAFLDGTIKSDDLKDYTKENARLVASIVKTNETLGLSKIQLLAYKEAQDLATLAAQGATEAQLQAVAAHYSSAIAKQRDIDAVKGQTKEYNDLVAAIEAEDKARNKTKSKETTLRTKLETAIASTDPMTAELNRHKLYLDEIKALKQDENAAMIDFNALDELETKRHEDAKTRIEKTAEQKRLAFKMQIANQVASIATSSINQIAAIRGAETEEEKKAAKEQFLWTQGLALANTIIQTELGATQARADPSLITTEAKDAAALKVRMQGYASAATIAATTFAGAFDKGGTIRMGEVGIAAEYRDELVNGVLVKGPARVTSSEETNNIMNQGGSSSAVQNITFNGMVDDRQFVQMLLKNSKMVFAATNKHMRNNGRRL